MPKPKFPFLDLTAQYASIRDEVHAAVQRVLDSQQFIMGPEVEALEREIAPIVGSKHAIACSSGSDALLLALMALGIGPGDEVITSPFTFVATAAAVARLGAKPVFADIDPVTYNIDPAAIARAITPRTKAIIPVHLYGLCADMDAILEIAGPKGIPVVEDAAQAIAAEYRGRRAGSMGVMGCFSFFPSKNLGGAGDGGLTSTNDDDLASKLRMLRVHGSPRRYEYELLGINGRLDALQAAILRVKLPHLADWNQRRREIAAQYCTALAAAGLRELELPSTPKDLIHVFHQFTIQVPERDIVRRELQTAGIPSEVYYPSPLHLQRAFQHLGYKKADFPHAESSAARVLSLPVFPELKAEQISDVANTLISYLRHKNPQP